MIPGKYDLELQAGDSFLSPLFEVGDLTSEGGPPDLSLAEVVAEIRGETPIPFVVERVADPLAPNRTVRLTLPYEAVDAAPTWGEWFLQVRQGAWRGTVLEGSLNKAR